MLGPYEGVGDVVIFDKVYKTYIILKPDNGEIVARIQHNKDLDPLTLFSEYGEIYSKSYEIRNLEVITPIAKVSRENLKDLQLVFLSPGPVSILDSALIRLGFFPYAGFVTLVFRPKNPDSFFVFDGLSDLPYKDSYYELMFASSSLDIPLGVSVEFDSGRVLSLQAEGEKLSSQERYGSYLKGFVLVRSNEDLFTYEYRSALYKVISLLNGGKVTLIGGYHLYHDNSGSKFQVGFNFSTGGSFISQSIGNPFKIEGYEEYQEVIYRFVRSYISHIEGLTEEEKRKFDLFTEYFIEGISMHSLLESKLITLFTALEIMDNSATLDKSSLADSYGIDIKKAEFLTKLRGRLVHNGLVSSEAIKETVNEMRSYQIDMNLAFLGDNKEIGCFLYLVGILYRKLIKLIRANDLVDNLKYVGWHRRSSSSFLQVSRNRTDRAR